MSVSEAIRRELEALRPNVVATIKAKGDNHEKGASSSWMDAPNLDIHDQPDISVDLANSLFEEELSALCLSGGGIRSASFCLGVLQALARCGLLSDFDYISTVSGGGYIGAWLSAWRKGVKDDLLRAHFCELKQAQDLCSQAETRKAIESCKEDTKEDTEREFDKIKEHLADAVKFLNKLGGARCEEHEERGEAEIALRARHSLREALIHLESLEEHAGAGSTELRSIFNKLGHLIRNAVTEKSTETVQRILSGKFASRKATCNSDPNPESYRSPKRSEQEATHVSNLRNFTSYLTPRRGVMSLDLWMGVATILRNLVLNWMLFLPLFLLLVSFPKLTVLCFQYFQTLLHSTAGSSASEIGSMGHYLLLIAIILYGASQAFASKRLIELDRRNLAGAVAAPKAHSETLQPEEGWSYLLLYLFAPFLAAIAASIVFFPGLRVMSCSFGGLNWPVIAMVGALLWALPFLSIGIYYGLREPEDGSRKERWLQAFWRLLFMRIFAGAAAGGAYSLIVFELRQYVCLWDDRHIIVLAISGFYLAHFVGGVVFAGLTSFIFDTSDRDPLREWIARADGGVILGLVSWTAYAALVLWDPVPDTQHNWSGDWPAVAVSGSHFTDWMVKQFDLVVASVGGASGLAAALFGFNKATREGKSVEPGALEGVNWTRVAIAGAAVFFSAIVFELSRVFDWTAFELAAFFNGEGIPERLIFAINSQTVAIERVLFWYLVGAGLMILCALVASFLININRFSLHAFYRNRLIRAYLGASNENRTSPDPFIDFDEKDNPKMHELSPSKPLHVINVTLNQTSTSKLAWQERKASSFTITPLCVGNRILGYRPSKPYGSEISLGTAMTISGAAVSSCMGYHSSAPLAFIMTLFNVRFGWWLGNPKESSWQRGGPKFAALPIVQELLGQTDDAKSYVYLTDGGHFDNLGIYEMVLRRCRTIVVVDAGEDRDFHFEDLGNVIRKVRIDLGVEISFAGGADSAPEQASARLGLTNRSASRGPAPYCAIGKIRYWSGSGEEVGTIIYLKPAIHGDEPEDIWSYASAHHQYPHESTANQFFSESQFESYRRLGEYLGSRVFGDPEDRDGRYKHSQDLERRATAHVERPMGR